MGLNNITLGTGTLYINNIPFDEIKTITVDTEDCPMRENKPIIKWDSSKECSFTCELKKKAWYKIWGFKWYQILWTEFKQLLNNFRWCNK